MDNLPAIRKNGPQQEGKVMARSRMQRGSVRLRKRRRGKDVWTIRYRVRSTDGWTEKVEAVPKAKNESDARKALERRIWEVNATNDPHRPRSIDFASFATGSDWNAYLYKRRVK